MAWPGSYMPAPIVMTQPRLRSRPATAATRSSLMPFWKSTMTPSGFFRYRRPRATPTRCRSDFTEMKTASNGSATDWGSWIRSARTGIRCSPHVPESRSPTFFIAST